MYRLKNKHGTIINKYILHSEVRVLYCCYPEMVCIMSTSSGDSHYVVESAERHHGRQTQKHHELQPLRLDGPVHGLENLKLVEQPLRLLAEHEAAEQERQYSSDGCTSLSGKQRKPKQQY